MNFEDLCHQAIREHCIPENHHCNLMERVAIMATENDWDDEKAVKEAVQCVLKEINSTE